MKTYRDLIVWQKAMYFVTEIYKQTKRYPKEELYGLVMQMRRSAVSVPSNIAEGYGRNSTDDYLRFIRVSLGSLFELQTQLEIAYSLKYLSKEEFANIYELSREIERMVSSLHKSIRKS